MQVLDARRQVLAIHMSQPVEEYIVQLVLATRQPGPYSEAMVRRISCGASPRATIALDRCARARAWLHGKDYVAPEDVQAIAGDVLRHRVLPSYEATAEGWDGDRLVGELLQRVPLP